MLNHKRVLSNTSEQGELLPTYPIDLVPKDHLSRVVCEVVESLDLHNLYARYGWEGGKVTHPKLMLRLLFYAYSQGNRSSRRISQACRENHVYMYLSGGVKPNFRTISEFRRTNLDFVKELFKQIVAVGFQLGMVKMGNISLDGTKIKANASNSKVVEKDKLTKELKRVAETISNMLTAAAEIDRIEDNTYGPESSGDELPEELRDAKKRQEKLKEIIAELDRAGTNKMSMADKGARFMKSKGRIQMSYNGQCATENQFILAYDLNNDKGDADQLIPMTEQLEELAQTHLEKNEFPLQGVKLIADAGYDSGKNLEHINDRKIDGYVAGQKDKVKAKEQQGKIEPRPYSKDKFTYHANGDYYECPEGEKLQHETTTTKAKKTYQRTDVIYRGTTCDQCHAQKDCVQSKTGFRRVARYLEYDPYREQMQQKMSSETGKELLSLRCCDVEPTFGQLKQAVFRDGAFLLRSTQKTKGEFGLACIAHNLKKIATYIQSGDSPGLTIASS